MTDDDTARLRDALSAADYRVDPVHELLGDRAAAALHRNHTIPGRMAVTGSTPLEVMTKLWRLQAPVPLSAARNALPLDALLDGGIVAADGDEVRALVDIRPYADDTGDWWVAADLTPELDGRTSPISADHVLGLNAASSTLARVTVRRPVGRSLDLGTGCGVQSLHLSRHSDSVIATDVNPRALRMAALTTGLNGVSADLRQGSLFEPVAQERFDLIATNPPFVVSPGGRHVYRDSGLAGDDVVRQVVVDGAARLAEGGILQSLGNWMHVRGQDWRERVGTWVAGTGCDAWVVQREVQDPAEYVELWLRDSGETGEATYAERYREWLSWFDANDVEGIGFGWINLRASGAEDATVRIEDWPHAVQQPLGAAVADWFGRAELLRADDQTLLSSHVAVADDIVLEQVGQPGATDPEHLVLRQHGGMMRAIQVGTADAGFVGACDGTLPVGAIIDAVAQVLEVDPGLLRQELVPQARSLIMDGFLVPAVR
ncbi:methyltransferase [Phytoactinopolyspora sp. XMNu-373]|uniref:Methyltransferase n=1 Tax=Phytoactinopolyspora mesophila TaxID=2650750 RepID=A0A7K3M3H3_9ACTN|nr:methyltransferase [Phytoactinopolyspora mesophila]